MKMSVFNRDDFRCKKVVFICLLFIILFILSVNIGFAVDGQIDILPTSTSGYTINQEGTYVLVSNKAITTAGVDGIYINSNNVTLDMNGHSLYSSGNGNEIGIRCATGFGDNVHIKNGRIFNFKTGISLNDSCTLENVTVMNNRGDGIKSGAGCSIISCKAIENQGHGINAGQGNTIEKCMATANNKDGNKAGIYADQNSTIINCVSKANNAPKITGADSYGIQTGDKCQIVSNHVTGNSTDPTFNDGGSVYGIYTGNQCVIKGNKCTDNSGANQNSTVIGIFTGDDCSITENLCSNNTTNGTHSSGYGIFCKKRCVVANNICNGNGAPGNVNGYMGVGIYADGEQCNVFGNTCNGNTGVQMSSVGIHTEGSGCRVVENDCSNHSGATTFNLGIWVESTADSVVIRNNTSNNTTDGLSVVGNGNYIAENTASDGISITGTNTIGTGDRSNITY